DQFLPLSMVRTRLAERFTLEDIDYRTGGPARYVRVAETGGRLGFITPLTHNFCESCNRVRITCTGTLFMCLGQEDAADLRGPLPARVGIDQGDSSTWPPAAEGNVVNAVLKFTRVVDAINDQFGIIANWLVLFACLVSAGNAAVRYGINGILMLSQESSYLHG